MIDLLNTLYVLTPGASLHLDHDAVRVVADGQMLLRAPLLRLESIIVFGPISVSPLLIHRCSDDGRAVVFMSGGGRFKARIVGPVRGNVLLRRIQHQALDDPQRPSLLARQFVAGKIQNSRLVLMRGARDSAGERSERLRKSAEQLASILTGLRAATGLDQIRGAEGEAARIYFESFSDLIRGNGDAFDFDKRTRRPPRSRVNSLLSFLYALVREECSSALEGVGLDPQVGYLHGLRPGRPSLALDLMEELRSVAADRLALTLINRRQLGERDFETLPGGAYHLNDSGRRKTLAAYQERKKRPTSHRLLRQRVPFGLIPHVQARLLARHLRGDLTHYPPHIAR